MTRRRILIPFALAGAVAGGTIPAVAGAAQQHTKTIKVADDYFGPKSATVKPNTRLIFRWSATNQDSHNVDLVRAPRGVHKHKTGFATTGAVYRGFVLKKKGTYKFVCQVHVNMKLSVRVK